MSCVQDAYLSAVLHKDFTRHQVDAWRICFRYWTILTCSICNNDKTD